MVITFILLIVSNIEIANKIHFIGLNLGYFLRVVFSKLDIS